MTAFASVFSPRVGCKYRPKKVPRTKAPTMLMVLAKLGFVLAFGLIGGVLLVDTTPPSFLRRLTQRRSAGVRDRHADLNQIAKGLRLTLEV